jgi:uncharacterized protein (UPF0276 family)
MGILYPDSRRKSGCTLLLDVNNVYVSSRNHDFDPLEVLASRFPHRPRAADFTWRGTPTWARTASTRTTAASVDRVWELYRKAVGLTGRAATLLNGTPGFQRLRKCIRGAEGKGISAVPVSKPY